MNDLIERLENATEPHRNLDGAINLQIFSQFALPDAPAYTASLDAAITLVPEGMAWTVSTYGAANFKFWASVGRPDDDSEGATAVAAAPALSLCIAALKARAENAVKVEETP